MKLRYLLAVVQMLGVLMWRPVDTSAEVVDRIVATAAGKAISFHSAVVEANYQALLSGDSRVQLNGEDSLALETLRPAISRLVDQLVIEQLRDRAPLDEPDMEDETSRVERMLDELRGNYSTAEEFAQTLVRYGFSEEMLRARMRRERRIMLFVDYSLRPQVRIPGEQVEAYYREQFVPQIQATQQTEQPGETPPELDQVGEKIEEILIQREINKLLEPWLVNLRRESGVRLFDQRSATAESVEGK
ncbi:MAG: hypothetical protein EXQ56_07680 [Acidobacteria bacterium]|nr:hypothetical protein [Acidobacteriota bacterium]